MARDLRKYASQTKNRLILYFLVILFMVGVGLIWWLYGRGAAGMGLLCLISMLLPVLAVILIMLLLNAVVKHMHRDD
jgi:hypothetical protein